jgi:hypothetical protein
MRFLAMLALLTLGFFLLKPSQPTQTARGIHPATHDVRMP